METHSRRNWLPGWQEGYVAIVRGFEDPGLLRADRESPTVSSVGKMAEGAQQNFSVRVGDVRSAFLRGDGIEMDREVFADPPPVAKALLGIRYTQIFRIVNAFCAFLQAPIKMVLGGLSLF